MLLLPIFNHCLTFYILFSGPIISGFIISE
uniref:Uncharacterized protein n=1 Tax=Arundo donax TaxID=35708 RepID=A0A0A9GLS8_ARUDO